MAGNDNRNFIVSNRTTNSLGAAVGEGNNSLSTQAAKRAMDANNPNKE